MEKEESELDFRNFCMLFVSAVFSGAVCSALFFLSWERSIFAWVGAVLLLLGLVLLLTRGWSRRERKFLLLRERALDRLHGTADGLAALVPPLERLVQIQLATGASDAAEKSRHIQEAAKALLPRVREMLVLTDAASATVTKAVEEPTPEAPVEILSGLAKACNALYIERTYPEGKIVTIRFGGQER